MIDALYISFIFMGFSIGFGISSLVSIFKTKEMLHLVFPQNNLRDRSWNLIVKTTEDVRTICTFGVCSLLFLIVSCLSLFRAVI